MEEGSLLVEIILGSIFVIFVLVAIIIDHRNGKRNSQTRQSVREEIQKTIKTVKSNTDNKK